MPFSTSWVAWFVVSFFPVPEPCENRSCLGLPTCIHSLRNLSSLKLLNLSQNALEELPPSLFDGVNLSVIDLSCNNLRKWDSNLFDLENLTTLDISHNKLQDLPPNACNNLKRSLLKLNLGGNQLTTLPNDLFNGFRKLRNLQLQNNQRIRLSQQLFQTLGEFYWAFLLNGY